MEEHYCNCNPKTGNFLVEEHWSPMTGGELEEKYSHDHYELMSFAYDSDRQKYVYVFAEVYN